MKNVAVCPLGSPYTKITAAESAQIAVECPAGNESSQFLSFPLARTDSSLSTAGPEAGFSWDRMPRLLFRFRMRLLLRFRLRADGINVARPQLPAQAPANLCNSSSKGAGIRI